LSENKAKASNVDEPHDGLDDAADSGELESYLTRIGYGHLFQNPPAPPPADEQLSDEPESESGFPTITPAAQSHGSPVSAPSRRLSGTLPAVVALAFGLLAIGYVLYRVTSVPPEPKFIGSLKLYAGSPYFSRDRFEAIDLGTTAEAVMDVLGPPVSRRAGLQSSNQESWYYAAISERNPEALLACIVTLEAGKVSRTKQISVPDATAFGTPWPGNCVLDTGTVMVATREGKTVVLNASDTTPYVLVCATGLNIEEELADVPAQVISVRFPPPSASHRPGGALGVGFGRRGGVAGPPLSPAQPAQGSTILHSVALMRFGQQAPRRLSPVCIFWKGKAYCLPMHVEGLNTRALKSDLRWLLNHLDIPTPTP
jgi:hypothetical protein